MSGEETKNLKSEESPKIDLVLLASSSLNTDSALFLAHQAMKAGKIPSEAIDVLRALASSAGVFNQDLYRNISLLSFLTLNSLLFCSSALNGESLPILLFSGLNIAGNIIAVSNKDDGYKPASAFYLFSAIALFATEKVLGGLAIAANVINLASLAKGALNDNRSTS